MFHLVHKPLTTPSFLLVDVLFFLFFVLATLPFPSVCLSLSVSHSQFVPHVIGEWAHVVPIWHVGNSLCLCLSVFLSVSPSFSLYSLSNHPLFLLCISTNFVARFSWLSFKGFYQKGNGDEERHAGWFPFATYLRVMDLRKSDLLEFIMRITNPPSVSWYTFPSGL